MIRFEALGSIELRDADGTEVLSVLAQPKRLALLAYLAFADPPGYHRRDELLALFWPESEADRARTALRGGLHYLRRSLGDHVLPARGDEVAVDSALLWSDVSAFREAVAEERWSDAVDLYRGDLLEAFHVDGAPEFERWVEATRGRLRAQASRAAVEAARVRQGLGDGVAAAHLARQAVDLAPYNEQLVREASGVLTELGDRAGALRLLEAFRERAQEELGVGPSSETLVLIRGLKDAPSEAPVAAPTPPYDARTEPPARTEPRPRRYRPVAVAGLTTVAAVVLAGAAWLALDAPGDDAEGGIKVAVFPPRALTTDPDGVWFAEGVQEEVLARLARIEAIELRSPQSVEFAGGRDVAVQALASRLDVRYVIDLSVQRLSNRVKVTVRVLDAAADEHVWAETLEWSWDDAFSLQGELAARIAGALEARVSPEERSVIADVPTRSREAWERYLQGRAHEREGIHGGTPERADAWRRAAVSFRSAVEADPAFALAWAHLAMAHLRLYWWGFDSEGTAVLAAREARRRAVELGDGLPEVALVLAYERYWVDRDFDGAWEIAAPLGSRLPGDVDLVGLLGALARRTGRVAEALPFFERSTALDPLNPFWRSEVVATLKALRRFGEAEAYLDRIEPLFVHGRFAADRAEIALLARGDAREGLEAVLAAGDRRRFWAWEFRARWMGRDYGGALDALDQLAPPVLHMQEGDLPLDLLYAHVHWLEGRPEEARRRLRVALPQVEALVDVHPETPGLRLTLAITLAGVGRCADALDELARIERMVSDDHWHGPLLQAEALSVRIRCGDVEGVLDRLPSLLERPVLLTVPLLRIHPEYDPLRKDPRFETVLREHGRGEPTAVVSRP